MFSVVAGLTEPIGPMLSLGMPTRREGLVLRRRGPVSCLLLMSGPSVIACVAHPVPLQGALSMLALSS